MTFVGPIAWVSALGEGEQQPLVLELAERLTLPAHLIHLIVLVEDKRFWIHPGSDPLAVIRAAYMNVRKQGRKQGGSTIPEQLAKLRSGRSDRTFRRRAQRSLSAIRMVSTSSKLDLLDEYLRTVYLGRGAYGVQNGAGSYFSKPAAELSVSESFFLAERIALPSVLRAARIRNLLRRNQVNDAVGSELHRLPSIYGTWFVDGEESVAQVVRDVSRERDAR
jgi:membrane peptidoglycan carboxypeptidase